MEWICETFGNELRVLIAEIHFGDGLRIPVSEIPTVKCSRACHVTFSDRSRHPSLKVDTKPKHHDFLLISAKIPHVGALRRFPLPLTKFRQSKQLKSKLYLGFSLKHLRYGVFWVFSIFLKFISSFVIFNVVFLLD